MVQDFQETNWDNRQVCVVVSDADQTVAYYEKLGLGAIAPHNWSFSGTLYGEPASMRLRLGLSVGGSAQMEVIEPSTNAVFHAAGLARRGDAGHHMGVFVSDLDAAVDCWAKAGVKPTFRGSDAKGTVELAYMDTAGIGGVYFEFIKVASQWAPSFADTPKPGTNLGEVRHVGVVVADMEKTVEFYRSLGIGPFAVRERDLENMRVPGRPGTITCRIKHAVSENCRLPIELIQPLGSGTIFHDSLDRQGEGIQHVCCWVPNLAAELARFESLGVEPLMANQRLAFMDTREAGGLVIELIERQSVQ